MALLPVELAIKKYKLSRKNILVCFGAYRTTTKLYCIIDGAIKYINLFDGYLHNSTVNFDKYNTIDKLEKYCAGWGYIRYSGGATQKHLI